MRCSWILDLVVKHDSVCWNHSNTVKGFWASVDNICDDVCSILSIFPPLLTGNFLLLRNEEVSDLYRPTSVVRAVTCSSIGWTGHMARAWETWTACIILIRKPFGKRPLEKKTNHKRKLKDRCVYNLCFRRVGYVFFARFARFIKHNSRVDFAGSVTYFSPSFGSAKRQNVYTQWVEIQLEMFMADWYVPTNSNG